jgi:hypothetical protein
MTNIREFKDSPVVQGPDEKIAFRIDVSKFPGTGNPTNAVVKLFDNANRDVSATYLLGSPSISGTFITTPLVQNLVEGKVYRIEVKWDRSGNTLEAFGGVECK